MKPTILIEVKPTVGAKLCVVDGQQLGQVFVQGYYAMIKYDLQTIVCGLTDRVTWHFLKLAIAKHTPETAIAASSRAGTKRKRTIASPPALPEPLLTVVWHCSVCSNTDSVAFMAKCLETEGVDL